MKRVGWLILVVCQMAAAQTTPFADRLYPILKNAGCPNCHNPNGVASATRLHFPDASASPERVEAFGRSLVRLIDREHPEESLLLKKPTHRIPHAGGERIKPGSPEESVLINWIRLLSAMPADELSAALKYDEASPENERRRGAVLRRLTNSQYNNTVTIFSAIKRNQLINSRLRILSAASKISTTHRIYRPCSKRLTVRLPKSLRAMRFGTATSTISFPVSPICHAVNGS